MCYLDRWQWRQGVREGGRGHEDGLTRVEVMPAGGVVNGSEK